MSFLDKLKQKKEMKVEAFPLTSFLSLILQYSKGGNHLDVPWVVPYWLHEFLQPIENDTDIRRRELNVFEGNFLTLGLARLTGIHESIIIDTVRRLE